MISYLSSESDFRSCIQKPNRLVLVDFYADWCEPCKWLEVILNEVAPEFSEEVDILKVDVEKFVQLGREFNIKSVPVLLVFRNGEPVWRMNGFPDKSGLVDVLQRLLMT